MLPETGGFLLYPFRWFSLIFDYDFGFPFSWLFHGLSMTYLGSIYGASLHHPSIWGKTSVCVRNLVYIKGNTSLFYVHSHSPMQPPYVAFFLESTVPPQKKNSFLCPFTENRTVPTFFCCNFMTWEKKPTTLRKNTCSCGEKS
jgi:hypothetical protein